MQRSAVCILLVMALFCGSVGAGGAQDQSATLHQLIKELGSDSFQAREEAQKELEKLPTNLIDQVRNLAENQPDPEIKARLLVVIGHLERELSLHPLPLTLHVEEANLAELAAQLNQAMGYPKAGGPMATSGGNEGNFSVDAEEMPFWEVLTRVNAGRGLAIGVSKSGYVLRVAPESPTFVAEGPFAVGTKVEAAEQGAAPDVNKTWVLGTTIMMDPRIRVAGATGIHWTEMVDEKGNDLLKSVMPEAKADDPLVVGVGSVMWTTNTVLIVPEKHGTRIASAKGTIQLRVGVGQEHIFLEDLERKDLSGDIETAQANVHLTKSQNHGPFHEMIVTMSKRVPENGSDAPADESLLPLEFRVTDARGVLVGIVRGNEDLMKIYINGAEGALRVEMIGPQKMEEVTVPVELRDIPLP